MAKKPVGKGGQARKKAGGKIKDLAAKSLGANKASSVKGGAALNPVKGFKQGSNSLKINGRTAYDYETGRQGFKF